MYKGGSKRKVGELMDEDGGGGLDVEELMGGWGMLRVEGCVCWFLVEVLVGGLGVGREILYIRYCGGFGEDVKMFFVGKGGFFLVNGGGWGWGGVVGSFWGVGLWVMVVECVKDVKNGVLVR